MDFDPGKGTLAHKFVKVGETSYLLPVHISMLSELLLITLKDIVDKSSCWTTKFEI